MEGGVENNKQLRRSWRIKKLLFTVWDPSMENLKADVEVINKKIRQTEAIKLFAIKTFFGKKFWQI